MKRLLSVILILLFTFNLCACSNGDSTNDNSNNSAPSTSTEDEIEPTVVELTKYNYSSYLNISITQTAQSQTLIYNVYYVNYRINYSRSEWRTYRGLTPPTTSDVIQCNYLYSAYSVLTTFTISCRSKNSNYTFSNSEFSISYRASSSQISRVAVYVSQDGNGSNVFMMSEELSSPNKSYSLEVKNMIVSFSGTVSFFENN